MTFRCDIVPNVPKCSETSESHKQAPNCVPKCRKLRFGTCARRSNLANRRPAHVPKLPNRSETPDSEQGKAFRKFRGVYRPRNFGTYPGTWTDPSLPHGPPDEEAGRKEARTNAQIAAPGRPARKSRVFNFLTDVHMTNEFMIRDSFIFSNRDKHLGVPSNGSLTPVGFCSVPAAAVRTMAEIR